jgi:DNA polymerase-3 subunit epsilon
MTRHVLALDVESTGLDPKKDQIVELGWALWDADVHELVVSGGALVHGVEIPFAIEKITGIRPEWPGTHGIPLSALLMLMAQLSYRADALVAHNAPFDRAFLEAAGFKRDNGLWIDTLTDLPHDGEPDSRKLRYLALDRGLVPVFPHRAQFDAILTAQLLGTFDFDAVLARAKSPNRIVRALVSYDDREKAKALGFRWEKLEGVDRVFTKQWVKRAKECDHAALSIAAKEAGFRIEVVP